jgi:hypothetical protein
MPALILRGPRCTRVLFLSLVLAGMTRIAAADRVDELAASLHNDSSYKVRVQAALILGKTKDPRAVAALSQALRDDNATVRGTAASSLGQIGDPSAKDALEGAAQDVDPFVRSQAQRALGMLGGGAVKPQPGGKGAKFYLNVGFKIDARGSPGSAAMVRGAIVRELSKLPIVTLSIGGGDPSDAQLQQRKLQGYMVDGTIQRLTATLAGGGSQIDCDLKAFVATYPGKSIKMMTTGGASLQAGASERESGKADCVQAAAEVIRDDVEKYLKSLQ